MTVYILNFTFYVYLVKRFLFQCKYQDAKDEDQNFAFGGKRELITWHNKIIQMSVLVLFILSNYG